MNDVLLRLGESRPARKLLKSIGVPLSLPVSLHRADGPWRELPLLGRTVVLGDAGAPAAPSSSRLELQQALKDLGAEAGAATDAPAFDALLFDASRLATPEQLGALHEFFQPLIAKLSTGSGRAVILGRPLNEAASERAVAAQGALEGFVRSLAKELGKKGATALLLRVSSRSEAALPPLLAFVLSARSAFITGQVLTLDAEVAAAAWPLVRPLRGKVALVTGAARGIGEASARLLAAEGAHVVCLDRPEESELLASVARAAGGSTLHCDLSQPEAASSIARALRSEHGGVDVVVHNAGVTRDKTLQRMIRAHWDQAIDVNLNAVLRIDEALSPLWREGAREICVASIAGIAGTLGQTNYAAAKSGLIAYVKRRARLLTPPGMTVNAVAPGLIETRLTAAMPVLVREAGRRLSALGQGGQPRDVAEAITFLASPGAVGLNGCVLRVCGGAFLGA